MKNNKTIKVIIIYKEYIFKKRIIRFDSLLMVVSLLVEKKCNDCLVTLQSLVICNHSSF